MNPGDPKYAADLIMTSVDNGANGFMFSVSETTLSILKELDKRNLTDRLHLYAIVPYAFDYVRIATLFGGIPGLVKKCGKDMVGLKNLRGIGFGLRGALTGDLASIMKTYLEYEISRVKTCVSKRAHFDALLLHQLITDMALALDLDWVFKSYIDFLASKNMMPGFNTGNFTFLINKLIEWNIDLRQVIIAAPFNKAGFQMTPSITECEKALEIIPEPIVIAISILAAGYLHPKEAVEYVATLPNIKGVAVGVSKEKHARETFHLLMNVLDSNYLSPVNSQRKLSHS